MASHNYELTFRTKGNLDIIEITGMVEEKLGKSGVRSGLICVFCPGATGALTTIEYEPGLVEDFPAALERLMPRDIDYAHHLYHSDGNGHSHVRASLIGPSITIPVVDGKMTLGVWQQIVFVDCDNRSRSRKLIMQILE